MAQSSISEIFKGGWPLAASVVVEMSRFVVCVVNLDGNKNPGSTAS